MSASPLVKGAKEFSSGAFGAYSSAQMLIACPPTISGSSLAERMAANSDGDRSSRGEASGILGVPDHAGVAAVNGNCGVANPQPVGRHQPQIEPRLVIAPHLRFPGPKVRNRPGSHGGSRRGGSPAQGGEG